MIHHDHLGSVGILQAEGTDAVGVDLLQANSQIALGTKE
jgi:hypothetical protein